MSAYSLAQLRIVRFYVQSMGTYDQQMSRPMEFTHTVTDHARLVERFRENGGKVLPTDLCSGSGQFIAPSDVPKAPIAIVDGWDSRRRRFSLEVEATDTMNYVSTYLYTGYTSAIDDSFTGRTDPNTLFIINDVSLVKTRRVQIGTRHAANQASLVYSHQVLLDVDFARRGGVVSDQKAYNMAPDRVFGNMRNIPVMGQMNGPDDMLHDGTTLVKHNGTAINRFDGLAGEYGAKILNTYATQSRAMPDLDSDDRSSFYTACSSLLRSNMDSRNPLMDELMRQRARRQGGGGGNFSVAGFTLRELADAFPGQRTEPESIPGDRGSFYQAGRGSSWKTATKHASIAAQVTSTVPAYMSQLALSSISFSITNMASFVRAWVTKVEKAIPRFKNTESEQLNSAVMNFVSRMESEFMPLISCNHELGIALLVKCDVTGEISINVQIDGLPGEEFFTAPVFADALYSPQSTTDLNSFNNLTQTFDYIGGDLVENGHSSYQNSALDPDDFFPRSDKTVVTVGGGSIETKSFSQTSSAQKPFRA